MSFAYRLKTIASRFSRDLGYKIERQLPEIKNAIDLLSLALISKDCFNECHFIQIGANDGETDDPIFKYINSVDSKWEGVLLEPQRLPFLKLSNKYADNARIRLENSAINEFDGPSEFFVSRNHDLLAGLSNKSLKNRVSKGAPIESIEVNCISPKTLYKKYNITRLDLLVVDTEGFDADAVMLILNSNPLPTVIVFEHINVAQPKLQKCFRILESTGYALLRHGIDVIAIREC